ncbi:Bromodomain containing protein [Tritrichomonas foetus]|uniref:Bromodomain containing protein n=1 Tax=Tritrichomonas foetus TaxID=1144522 RepID=A0A1J4JYZ6_9EUKA|nr:Bromodomain containing protein [Tritrichomonas foetus]|eukprot:OHT04377.1 Bromodomain containing protein [Tritrichomonas foetus]
MHDYFAMFKSIQKWKFWVFLSSDFSGKMMNELLRKRAIDVVDRLMSHPSTKHFITFSNPSEIDSDAESMDLSSIRQRLVENKYNKLQLWLNDVEQCWATVEKRNAENPTENSQNELVLAAENRRLFEKEKRAIDILSAHNWGNELVRLRSRIFDIMIDPPPKVKSFASSFINSNIVKANQPSISEHELKCFVEASEKLTSEEDNNELYRIVSEFQPDLITNSADLWFDVSKLNHQTFNALRNFIKAAFEKIGQKYPE